MRGIKGSTKWLTSKDTYTGERVHVEREEQGKGKSTSEKKIHLYQRKPGMNVQGEKKIGNIGERTPVTIGINARAIADCDASYPHTS